MSTNKQRGPKGSRETNLKLEAKRAQYTKGSVTVLTSTSDKYYESDTDFEFRMNRGAFRSGFSFFAAKECLSKDGIPIMKLTPGGRPLELPVVLEGQRTARVPIIVTSSSVSVNRIEGTKGKKSFVGDRGLILTDPNLGTTSFRTSILSNHIYGTIFPGAKIGDSTKIGQDTIIGSKVELGLKTEIGSYSVIGYGSTIHESSIAGSNCIVGSDCELSPRVTLNEEVFVGCNSILPENSYVGTGCVILPGTIFEYTVNIPNYAVIGPKTWFMRLGPIGSRGDYVFCYTARVSVNGVERLMLLWTVGCQENCTTEYLLNRVDSTYGTRTIGLQYKQLIKFVLGLPSIKSLKKEKKLDTIGKNVTHGHIVFQDEISSPNYDMIYIKGE